jgi:hypothetical protein
MYAKCGHLQRTLPDFVLIQKANVGFSVQVSGVRLESSAFSAPDT